MFAVRQNVNDNPSSDLLIRSEISVYILVKIELIAYVILFIGLAIDGNAIVFMITHFLEIQHSFASLYESRFQIRIFMKAQGIYREA